jgi:hypothetical protein
VEDPNIFAAEHIKAQVKRQKLKNNKTFCGGIAKGLEAFAAAQ